MKNWINDLLREIYQVSSTLFRIMVPVLLLVKLLEEMGAIYYLSLLLEPLMALVGLPESMGLVWATTLFTNIYGGMIMFFSVAQQETLSVAQVTVLSSMLLLAHTLPVEGGIAQKAGVRLGFTLLLRLTGAFVLGFILHHLYSWGDWLQQPNQLFWTPEMPEPGMINWAWRQLESLAMVQLIIIILMTLLKLLRSAGVERLLIWLLQPLLRLLGIGPAATTITLIGVTLGLAFGGGLLIKEAKAGHVSKRDVFSAMALLALCHSLIEDTLLVMLLGADISGVLWMRLLFALVVVTLLTRLVARCSDGFHQRYLVTVDSR
ncbi:MAG: hypothetical protein ABW148_13595 [Sedimenticola sp.]